jgi:5S rRNA maturation endonuclease (ribonuclease M5)
MNPEELLGKLDRVRKTKDGWIALCPAHADKSPSLSVGVGQDGQILLRCFAGCRPEGVVEALGLRMVDLFPPKDASPGPQPARQVPRVERWLRDSRGFPESELAELFATEGPRGATVVFRYRDDRGRVLYDKYRALESKRFWRRPTGTPSALYGLWRLPVARPERMVVVEGELDAHALWCLGIDAVSVPDGCGSRLASELLAPLAPFRQIILAVDSDTAGDELASRLATALHPERCLRARFQPHKDANDALRAGWQHEEFEQAVANASPCSTSTNKSPPSIELAKRYQVIDGRTCYLRTDRNGNELVEVLANFGARVEEEITFDDGAEVRREFRIVGELAIGEPLSPARVGAAEFAGLAWVTREWGIRAVVSAGQGTKDHLRTAMQHLSSPRRRRVFRHTGWIEHQGAEVFLYQGGAVGASDVEVDLPPPLDRFILPAMVRDPREALRTSLRLLDCAPLEVTAPLLASIYVSPVATVLNPDVTVWLHGASGSLKSTLCALAQGHFGDFDRKTLSGTWTSTENSLENRLFSLKDVLSVIDDYAPQADLRAQRELDRRVQRILRNVGNRAGRGRLTAELTQRPERPPRGFLLCNGEELPPGVSINARLVPVEVERESLNMVAISDLQERGLLLREAMRTYIEWLRPQMPEFRRTLSNHRDEIRKDMQRGSTSHLRQPEASANLFVGLDLFLRCSVELGALANDEAARLADRLRGALHGLARRHTQGLAAIHPAEIFVDVLSTLHTQGKIRLADINDPFSGSTEVEMLGWRKGDVALVLPEAAHRRVAMFVRESGEHWAPSMRELHKELVARGYAMSTPDGRDGGQWRVGADRKKKRGWLIPLSVFSGGPQSASDGPQDDSAIGDTPPRPEQLGFKGNEAIDPFLPPLPPEPEPGHLPCWDQDSAED